MINSDEDIARVAGEISERLQALNDYLGPRNHDDAKIRFPRGYLRSCAHHREKYSFIKCKIVKSNIAYAKLTTDIFRWMLNRTDLSLTAREMLIKQGIFIIASVLEAIMQEVQKGKPGFGKKKGFKKRIQKLVDEGVVSTELQDDLNWIWDVRNNSHLVSLTEPEYQKYSLKEYNRAIRALQKFRISLGGQP